MNQDLISIEELQQVNLAGRVEIAQKVGHLIAKRHDYPDYEAALELARLLVEDLAISVREALSKELRHCSFLPRDIMCKIATDIEQVSTPFLIASKALDEKALEALIREGSDGTHSAIAQRNELPEMVAFALCSLAGVRALERLADNDTAAMSERSFNTAIDRFPEERTLMEKLAARADLPVSLVERLISKVSSSYGEYLTAKFSLASDYSSYLISMANRQVFTKALDSAPTTEIENYLRQLKAVGGITSDILLNYLQNANLRLFIAAVAVLIDASPAALHNRLVEGEEASKVLARVLESAGFSRAVIRVLLIAYERHQ